MAAPEAVSSRGMKNQVRIRGPKPDVSFNCKSLDELESLLRKHIDACKDKSSKETAYAQFIFDVDVTFRIKDTSDGIREHFPHMANLPPDNEAPVPLPVSEAVAQVPDTKAKLRRQRAVGRAILKSINQVDGFNYFEKEAWDTKHADGYRFKYLCKDSYQNKDRALNKTRKSTDASVFQSALTNSHSNNGTPGPSSAAGLAGGAEHGGDQSPGGKGDVVSGWFRKHGLTPPAAVDASSPARLPTYDCKGSIFVKFSSSQQIVDVVYQHMPVHNASNERAPDPIEPPKSKSVLASNGTALHEDSADLMDTSEMASYATPQAGTPSAAAQEDSSAAAAALAKGKKRKRASNRPARQSLIEAETSDPEAMDDDWNATADIEENQAPPPPLLDPSWEPDPGDGDLWRPSVVTLVPGIKPQTKAPTRKSYGSAAANTATASASAAAVAAADDSSASGSDFDGGKKPKKKGPKGGKAKGAAAAAANASKEKEREREREREAQDSDRQAGLRRRTKTGCWTCRNRKLKCDELRPQCSQCARSRPPRECSFPEDEDMSDAPPL